VPDMETGCCLGSEGNGVSLGEGNGVGPELLERGKDKQSMPSKGGTTWGRTRRNNQIRRDGGGLARTEQAVF
jgi:hypothetical protein